MWKTVVYEQRGVTKLISVGDDGGVRCSSPYNLLRNKRSKPVEQDLMKINSVNFDVELNMIHLNADLETKTFDESITKSFMHQTHTENISSAMFAIDVIVPDKKSKDNEEVLLVVGGALGLLRIQNISV